MTNVEFVKACYAEARTHYPILPVSIDIRENPDLSFHTEAGAGYIHIRTGYQPSERTAYHEIGHVFDKAVSARDPEFRNKYWAFRFAGCPSTPKTWQEAENEARVMNNAWAFLPIESLAEAFSISHLGAGTDKAMDWGCTLDKVAGKTFFETHGALEERRLAISSLVTSVTLSPNRWKNLNIPKYIVLHTTQGIGSGSLGWMLNPLSQVSAQYLVMENGDIIAMGDERDANWHAGVVNRPRTTLYTGVNPNLESIGIEIAGWNTVPIGSQQVSSTAALIRDIRNRRGPLPVIAHADLDTINRFDPGTDNFNRVMAEVNSEVIDLTDEDVKRIIRYMFLNQEGYDLVENAILHQYGPKLQAYLDQRFAEAETRIVDAIVERLRNG